MQKIPLKLAEAGMVLAKPVLTADGMVLAGEDLTLSKTIIERLASAGTENIVVKGRPAPDLDTGLKLDERIDRLDFLFRKYRDNPFMWTLRGMVEQYFNSCLEDESKAFAALKQDQG